MASIATLTIDLVGKSAKLTAELNKANKNTKSWSDKTSQMVGTASKAFAGMAVVGAGALTAIYAKNAEFIDQQAKTADRLGTTTEALTGLQHAAEQTGASTETLNMGLQRMTRRLADESAEAQKGLDMLGVTFDQLKGKSPDQQFALIAEKMKDVDDQGKKVAITQKLFDSEGVKLLNTLELGADGIQRMIQEADELGITFNRIDAAKVEMANDSFDKAQKTTHSFGQTLATETAPIIGALSELWTENAKEAGGFGVIAQNIIEKVSSGIGFLSDMGRGLQVTFLLIKQAGYEIFNAFVQGMNNLGTYTEPLADLLGLDKTSFQKLSEFSSELEKTTDEMGQDLQNLINEPMPSTKIEAWVSDVQTKFQAAAEKQINGGKKTNLSDLLLEDDASSKSSSSTKKQTEEEKKAQAEIDIARNKYQQIFDAQLELEGKEAELATLKYERKRLEMEQEYELLREKNLVTSEIESEYRTAKEQLELQHKENINQIDREQRQIQMDGYSEILSAVGSYFDGMEGKKAGYARAAVTIGQTLLDEEKRNAIQSIWTNTYDTAMKAYNSLSVIPIIGPALGATAAGVVLGAGAMYAGKVTGLSSYDGGGYTGDGARIGGMDGKGGMLAMVHPQETIIDHTKGQQANNQQVALNYNFYGSSQENEQMINRNRNTTIRDARRLSSQLSRPF